MKKNIILIISCLTGFLFFYLEINVFEKIRYLGYHEILNALSIKIENIQDELIFYHLIDYMMAVIISYLTYKFLMKMLDKSTWGF